MQLRHRTTGHELGDDVGLAVLVADVEHGDDVGVVAEARHRPGFAVDAAAAGVVEPVGLDDRDGDVAAEPGVARGVHDLARAFAEQTLHPVTVLADGRGQRRHARPTGLGAASAPPHSSQKRAPSRFSCAQLGQVPTGRERTRRPAN